MTLAISVLPEALVPAAGGVPWLQSWILCAPVFFGMGTVADEGCIIGAFKCPSPLGPTSSYQWKSYNNLEIRLPASKAFFLCHVHLTKWVCWILGLFWGQPGSSWSK